MSGNDPSKQRPAGPARATCLAELSGGGRRPPSRAMHRPTTVRPARQVASGRGTGEAVAVLPGLTGDVAVESRRGKEPLRARTRFLARRLAVSRPFLPHLTVSGRVFDRRRRRHKRP